MGNRLNSTIVTVLSCSLFAACAADSQVKIVPVLLHPDTDHGSCSIGLQVNAGGAVMRSGPSFEFPVVAKFKAGHVVSGCNSREGWEGIIDGQDGTCSVGISVAKTQAYAGPCASGWIDHKSLTAIYG